MSSEVELPKFGDYITVEQHRYGAPNEHYLYKVIGTLESNSYIQVPVVRNGEKIIGKEIFPIVRAVCCGVCEETVERFRVQDVKLRKVIYD